MSIESNLDRIRLSRRKFLKTAAVAAAVATGTPLKNIAEAFIDTPEEFHPFLPEALNFVNGEYINNLSPVIDALNHSFPVKVEEPRRDYLPDIDSFLTYAQGEAEGVGYLRREDGVLQGVEFDINQVIPLQLEHSAERTYLSERYRNDTRYNSTICEIPGAKNGYDKQITTSHVLNEIKEIFRNLSNYRNYSLNVLNATIDEIQTIQTNGAGDFSIIPDLEFLDIFSAVTTSKIGFYDDSTTGLENTGIQHGERFYTEETTLELGIEPTSYPDKIIVKLRRTHLQDRSLVQLVIREKEKGSSDYHDVIVTIPRRRNSDNNLEALTTFSTSDQDKFKMTTIADYATSIETSVHQIIEYMAQGTRGREVGFTPLAMAPFTYARKSA